MHFALATFFGRPFRDHPLVLLAEPPPVRAIRLSSSWSCSFSSFVGLAARSGPLFLLWSVGLCALLCVAVGCSASPRAPVAPTFASRPVRALRAVWIDAPVLALRFRPGVHVRALRSWRHLLLFALFASGDLLFPLLALFLLPVSRSSLLTTSALVRALRFWRLQFLLLALSLFPVSLSLASLLLVWLGLFQRLCSFGFVLDIHRILANGY